MRQTKSVHALPSHFCNDHFHLRLGLSSGLYPSPPPPAQTLLGISFFSPIRATPTTDPILLDFIALSLAISTNDEASRQALFSSPLLLLPDRTRMFFSVPYCRTQSVFFFQRDGPKAITFFKFSRRLASTQRPSVR